MRTEFLAFGKATASNCSRQCSASGDQVDGLTYYDYLVALICVIFATL
jgi:hypothetical protein